MGYTVEQFDDAGSVLEQAGAYLRAEPIRHNLLLTLLSARAASGDPGRYWVVTDDGGAVAGTAFQSPLDFAVALSAMTPEAAQAAAEAVASGKGEVPGVNGEAAPAAAFAGRWTECSNTAATVVGGQRIYEARTVTPPAGVAGNLRLAAPDDRPQVVAWMAGFQSEVGERGEPEAAVDIRMASDLLWVWDTADGAVSMAAVTRPVEGVTRVQAVYTPADRRGHGYAAACVAALTQQELDRGHRVCLYTDLGNATSNGVYRRIGYVAVAEALRYRFTH